MSKLNEGILKNLAKKTGGKYIHAVPGDKDIVETGQEPEVLLVSRLRLAGLNDISAESLSRFRRYRAC